LPQRHLKSTQSSKVKKLLYAIAALAALLLAAVSATAIFVVRTWDRTWDVPVPELHASTDPEVIRRGQYLVYGPAHCVQCHAGSMAEYLEGFRSGNPVPLRGGVRFSVDRMGAVYSKNLTPDPETGIGRYTDGQLARMLRSSVRPDGKASVRVIMPFEKMSDDDVVAILSFLRSQPPVRHVVPETEVTVLGRIVKSFSPTFKPRENVQAPARAPVSAPTRQRGEYLVRSVANCGGCHTKNHPITLDPVAPPLSGGEDVGPVDFPDADPNIRFVTPNLTPAKDSALNKFPDRTIFIARFKRGGRQYPGSPMPWEAFATMTDDDLGAIYEYLHSLAPQAGPTGETWYRKVN
jgi:mono/diheme cytochrome c family protein